MEKINILKLKYENQIEKLFDTLVEIQDIEETEWPMDHISNKSKTMLGMCFQSILMRHVWDIFTNNNLPTAERLKLITEIWESTHEHYRELYGFDSKKIANNM